MNLFTDYLGFFVKLLKALLGRPGEQGCGEMLQVFVWEVSPHLEGEAGELVHQDVVSFGFLSSSHTCVWSERLFQLSCSCCRWGFTQSLRRTCRRRYLPRAALEGWAGRGRQEQSSSSSWGRGCGRQPWELRWFLEVGRGRGRGRFISCWCWRVLNRCLAVLGDVLLPSFYFDSESFPT